MLCVCVVLRLSEFACACVRVCVRTGEEGVKSNSKPISSPTGEFFIPKSAAYLCPCHISIHKPIDMSIKQSILIVCTCLYTYAMHYMWLSDRSQATFPAHRQISVNVRMHLHQTQILDRTRQSGRSGGGGGQGRGRVEVS